MQPFAAMVETIRQVPVQAIAERRVSKRARRPAAGTIVSMTDHGDSSTAVSWDEARRIAHAAGAAAPLTPVETDLASCDGRILAEDVTALVDLPPFDSSRVDGYAVRGPGPWTLVDAALLEREGTAVRIATGGMLPGGTDAIVRAEEMEVGADGRIDGRIDRRIHGHPRSRREWRTQGEQAHVGDLLVPAGTPVTPAVIGTAASAGHDRLSVYPHPRLAMILLGSETLAQGLPDAGRIRDALGPQLPLWARRLGVEVVSVAGPESVVDDTTTAHRLALEHAIASGADLIATVGGNTYGSVSTLRRTLADLRAEYLLDTVRARPGKAMRLARIPRPDGVTSALMVGMPASPQPALLTLLTLIAPAYAGMTGRALPDLPTVTLAAPAPGRGDETRLVPARFDRNGHVCPVEHESPKAVHGLAGFAGFAVIAPGTDGAVGDRIPFLYLPITPAESSL